MTPADAEAFRQLAAVVSTMGPLGPALVVLAVIAWAEYRLLPRLPKAADVQRDKAIGRAIAERLGISEDELRAAAKAEDERRELGARLPLGTATAATILPGPAPRPA